ncbi:MAG: hypothetical protein LBC98_01440 [Prevotellaceae bacterium]|jgi:hypothetical protein|nr:hypothetical protein [Prevotellaceae bacterium]
MKINKLIILLLLIFGFANCRKNDDKWQAVQYSNTFSVNNLSTHCTDNIQTWEKAQVYFEADTLVIAFFAQLPAYWRNVVVKVHNGNFRAETSGIPFELLRVDFQTKNQQLQLDKQLYAIGDTLRAVCDFIFRYIETAQTKDDSKTEQGEFAFRGTVCEIIRTQDFDPFDEKNFMTFDLPTALRELGEPLNRKKFTSKQLRGKFRSMLLLSELEIDNDSQTDNAFWIEELTWDLSPTRNVSDEGKERLTIWYFQNDSTNWLPADFLCWNEDRPFF